MIYESVCSGIEAASVAWEPLGWRASFLSEIEAFPRAVLSHHYPETPLHGDFTTIKADDYAAIDLLVGGTPCQSFSIAGLRKGLDDDRGNLALEYIRLAQRLRPRWLVWENVPGVLSSGRGRDFGSILGALGEIGYGWAYRVLDAQYVRVDGFGRAVPQRRRRVFVVGHLGDWRRAAAVLFERESLSGNTPPRREPGQGIAASTLRSTDGGSDVDHARANGLVPEIVGTLSDGAHNGGGLNGQDAYTGRIIPVAFSCKDHGADAGEIAPTLRAMGHAGSHANAGGQLAVAFSIMPMNSGKDYKARETDVAQPIMAGGPVGGNQGGDFVAHTWRVRRLTPEECEALQGFPRGYTNIPYRNKNDAPDGPRYKALGNSMAVNCMRWIGRRIEMVDALETTP
jgi:DNA (cytosine-5)-methyltransferase 1